MAELKFVDGIGVAPTVLLDLAARPLAVTSFAAPPPSMRRNEVSSFLVDGAVDAATAYDRRDLSIGLAFVADSAVSSADSWHQLVRRLTSPSWLLHVDDTGNSLFFRTHPSSPSEVAEYRAALSRGERTATLTIPADPFAYGLPESGTATVVNDPTQPNGMRFVIDGVKGDVPAPLRMEAKFDGWFWPPLGQGVVSWAAGFAATTYAGFHHGVSSSHSASAPDWTASTVNDSAAIGGSFHRFASTGSVGPVPYSTVLPDVGPGEYRMLVRARSSAAASVALALHGHPGSIGTRWRWVDLGVHRFPHQSVPLSPWNSVSPVNARATVDFVLASPGAATIDVDHVLLVPAPGMDGSLGSLGHAGLTEDLEANSNAGVVIDGQAGAAWSADWVYPLAWSMDGGLPSVSPGVENRVYLWCSRDTASVEDAKTRAYAIDWSYHPRYLYLRGD